MLPALPAAPVSLPPAFPPTAVWVKNSEPVVAPLTTLHSKELAPFPPCEPDVPAPPAPPVCEAATDTVPPPLEMPKAEVTVAAPPGPPV